MAGTVHLSWQRVATSHGITLCPLGKVRTDFLGCHSVTAGLHILPSSLWLNRHNYWHVYLVQEFDGASKRNPGPAGFGAVLYDNATGQEVSTSPKWGWECGKKVGN